MYTSNDILEKSTYYILDAQGNTISVYEREVDNTQQMVTYAQAEKHIYGSSRLGVLNTVVPMLASQNQTYSQATWTHSIGERTYEISNHLGNVLSVISDKPIPHVTGSAIDYYMADLRRSQDYSPFGVTLEGRGDALVGAEDYRYGFQGQEMDDEIKGQGNSVNYAFRMHDSRVGRFFTRDPLASSFSYNSPYSFSENRVIDGIELEGLEWYYTADGTFIGNFGDNSEIRVINSVDAEEGKKWVEWAMGCSEVGRDEAAEYNNQMAMESSVSLIHFYAGDRGQMIYESRIEATGKILDHLYTTMFGDIYKLRENRVLIGSWKSQDKLLRLDKNLYSNSELQKLEEGTRIGRATTGNMRDAILVSLPVSVATYDDFKAMFEHERKHQSGDARFGGAAWGEFAVHNWETNQAFFTKTTSSYKNYTLDMMQANLKKQQGYVFDNPNDSGAKELYKNNVKLYQKAHTKIKGKEDTGNNWNVD